MRKGRFITFEGPEGGGKSTQIKKVLAFLQEKGINAITSREPGGTKLAEQIRNVLQCLSDEPPCPAAEVLLFEASRAQHVKNLIEPSLNRGIWVLCDRFEDSTFAYQGFGRGFDIGALRQINSFATNCVTPDLVFILDLPPSVSYERIVARSRGINAKLDRIEQEPQEFHRRLRDGFLTLAKSDPNRYVCIDATLPIEEVASAIIDELKKRYSELAN